MGKRGELAEALFASADDGDETPEDFQCPICLDLLYKPVVLACGHVSCFWCVNKSMNGLQESYCAICRQPYQYFPSICPLLHHLLLKKESVVYKRREKEVFEQEKKDDNFSPQFIECLTENCNGKLNSASGTKCSKGNAGEILVSDVLCLGCREILFRPVVLNCGHAFCEACMVDQMNENIKCQICETVHPGQLPKVCWDLEKFLKVHFPQEYARRWASFQDKRVQIQTKGQSSCAFTNAKKPKKAIVSMAWGNEMRLLDMENVHIGVGCDACGIYPMMGKRYRCKDCKEAIGFDLCETCYNTSSKRPGRFNQQHTPDHTFVLDDSNLIETILNARSGENQLDLVAEGDDPNADSNLQNR